MPKRTHELPAEYEINERTLGRAIGARLKVRRKALALTQEHLRARVQFEQVYISRARYSRIEKGDDLPDAAELLALRAVLGVSFEWLMLGVGGP